MTIPGWWARRSPCKRNRLRDLPLRNLAVGFVLLAIVALLPTPASAAAELHIEKTAGDVISSGYNTYLVPISFVVTNTGSERLTNLQLQDDLDIFRSGNVVDVGPIVFSQGSLDLNQQYNGTDDTNLLTGDDSLEVGATVALHFDLTFDAAIHAGPYINQVIASAEGESSGTTVTRVDDAVFELPLHPEIEFIKTAGVVVNNFDGTYSVPITLDITNVGEEEIERLQLKDDLDIFGSGRVVSVDSVQVLSGNLALRSDFDGLNEVRLLTGRDTLAIDESASVRFNATFEPGSETGPFTNWAIAWTAGAESQIGIDVGARAYINLPQDRTGISINKSAGDVRALAGGILTVPITLAVTNTGDEPLQDLQLTDNLEIFGDGELVGVDNLQSQTLSVNENFDGSGDQLLLQPGNVLAAGDGASVTFALRFRTGTDTGPYTNIADVLGTGSFSGTPVSDSDSADILGFPTQTNPVIEILKTAGAVTRNSDGTNTVPISLTITNTGNEAHSQLQVVDSLDIFGTGSLLAVNNIVAPELSLNPGYNGLTDTSLLTGTDVLDLAGQVTITFDIQYDSGDEPGPFVNFATATAISEITGTRVTDTDDASIPAHPPGITPDIQIIKTTGVVADNGDGSWTVDINLAVTNIGDEPLVAVQIEDDLDIFGTGQLLDIESISTADFNLNTNYNGESDTLILEGNDVLAVGDTGTVTLSIRFDPGNEPGPFQNVTIATAIGAVNGAAVSDSDDALIHLVPTPPMPDVSINKTASAVTENGDGSRSVDIDLTVTNTGNEALRSVQIEDNLDIFGTGELLGVENISTSDFNLNANYNGEGDTLILEGNDVLAVGDSGTVTFSIRFNPANEPGPFRNVSIVTAVGDVNGTPVSDTDDASIPAGPPGPMAEIELAKTAGVVTDNGDGTRSVPITLTISNTGNEVLNALQVVDDLRIFGNGTLLAVEDISAPGLTLNSSFDGESDFELLDGSDNLSLGDVVSITFVMQFDPADEPGPFRNSATASATSETTGTEVSSADDALIPTGPPVIPPAVEIIKTAGVVTDNGDGSRNVDINLTVTNNGQEPLASVQIEDNLDIFGTGELLGIENISSNDFALNVNYSGVSDTLILVGNDSLAVGSSGTVTFSIQFDPGDEPGPFINISTVTSVGEISGTLVADVDDALISADPTPPVPDVSIDKTAGLVSENSDGSLSVDINLIVTNTGNEALGSVQIEDDLDIFGDGNLVDVANITSPDFALNPNYDGENDILLLGGSDVLTIGSTGTVTFSIRFDPGDEPGPFLNIATVTAVGEVNGTTVTDVDDAPIPAAPTPPMPDVSISKTAGAVTENADGSLSVDIDLTVTNTGNEALGSVQIEDDLDIFGSGELVNVENITSTDFTLNPNYDGDSDTLLLSGGDILAVGSTSAVTFSIRFNPANEPGPFLNVAVVTATGEVSGTPISDSDDAPIPAVASPTPPVISIEKTAGIVSANGDGSLSVDINLTVTNIGREQLNSIQIEDNLNIFGTGELVDVENVDSAEFFLSSSYDGENDTLLLNGSDVLAIGGSGSVTFSIRFDPGDEPGPFLNTAIVTAVGEVSGLPATDADDALIPAAPTPPMPDISIAKTAGIVSENSDGSLSVDINLTVTNTGNEQLSSVQIEDDLDIFGTGELIDVENLSSADFSLNTNYNGETDTLLLTGSDLLAIGGSGSVTFSIRFDPANELGPFRNISIVTAVGEVNGTPVTDTDDAPIPAAPTPPMPEISIEKTAGIVSANADGSFSVDINLTVTNTGNEVLGAVQIEDNLDIFGTGELLDVENLGSTDFTVNTNYNGDADILLLSGSDVLAIGESGSVTFAIRFNPAEEEGPFENTAFANATSETTGTLVTDSNDALFPPGPPLPMAAIALDKRAGSVTDNGDGTLTVPIALTITNTGDETLTTLQVTDDLDIFGSGRLVAIENLSAPGLSLNSNYDGFADQELLDSSDTLPIGGVELITFDLRFEPGDETEPRINIAITTAIGDPSGDSVDATDDASFLPFPTEVGPAIRLLKTADQVIDNDDNSFSVPFELTVTNTGDERLTVVQIEDDLDIFGFGELLEVIDIVADGVTLNPAYDGLTDLNILQGDDALETGTAATINFTLRFDPADEPGPFENTAVANAIGDDSGTAVSDVDSVTFVLTSIPPPPPGEVLVTKVADRQEVMRGDLVGYDVTVTSLSDFAIADIAVVDQPPKGFVFVARSALLIRAGPDGRLGSRDDISVEIDTTGSRPIVFDTFDLAANEAIIIRYLLKVSVGVVDGEHVNSVTVDTDNTTTPPTFEPVNVVSDPIFEKTTLIGKVFDDRDGDLKQGDNEPGIPGVRLATVSGLTMETDAEGRYHLAGIDVARFERGANFIIKVDESTLPDGSKMLSENPRVIRLTQAIASRVNFAVGMSEAGRETCLRACFTVTPVFREKTNIQKVYFDSGVSIIPDNYAMDIRNTLNKYSDRYRPRLRFIGYADKNPVGEELAARLGVPEGTDGNMILSENRAREVCEFATQHLGIEADCGELGGPKGAAIEGRGSNDAVPISSGSEAMKEDRRVEVAIDYFEVEEFSAPESVEQVRCDVAPAINDLDALLGRAPRITTPQLSCVNYREPVEDIRTDRATAREIRVSGGLFGCNRLITDVLLPGVETDDGSYARSIVTAHASDYQDGLGKGSVCPGTDDIRIGHYPIQISTDMGSRIRISSAGDVFREQDPTNDEHIVVTPFRDDTDLTVISALRISNEGVEPELNPLLTPTTGGPPSYQTIDTLNLDPRLDVLALDHAVVGDNSFIEKIRFTAYTNYAAFIKYYALDLYGIGEGGYSRVHLLTLTSDNIDYGRTFTVHGGSVNVSAYDELEYVLRASDCEALSTDAECHVDITKPRLLKIHSDAPTLGPACETVFCGADRLWGQTNLAVQRIPVYGARVRTFGPEEPGLQTKRVYGKLVPFGAGNQYVLEEHLRPTEDVSAGSPGTNEADKIDPISADASGISISGGLFGCGITVEQNVPRPQQPRLPGREAANDPIEVALTIVAEHSQPPIDCGEGQLAGAYPIVVKTDEGSRVLVTATGEVVREQLPESSINRQRIVVTPFRDDTKNSVVSALRITNEGVQAYPDEVPIPTGPITPRLEIPEEYNFTVALANLTIGANNLSGNRQLLSGDEHFDGSTYTDGRLAVFTKRRVNGKYTLTAQLDTTEDELHNLSDNLKRKDPRRVFRQLDPNRHYGVYGDDSTTTSEVDTQGAMYLNLGWNNNNALWGNYNTGLTGTEFAQYNRSLYGAKFRHENQIATRHGDSKTELSVFGSEAQSLAAHVTFQATGGSLYYLQNIDIVQGSEKVWIEVRRRDTEQVVEREVMFQGRDYEIDALQGRIILNRPLSQIVAERSNSIIRSAPLEGDEVFLLVDYEYVPSTFSADEITYGARGRGWLGDSVGIGATTVVDGRNGGDYNLQGLDVVLKKNERTYLRGEFATSEARQNNANFISFDGGLSFQSQAVSASGMGSDGNAIGLEGRVDLSEVNEALRGDLRAWSKSRDAGFSTGRLGQGVSVNDRGFESQLIVGEIEISASFTDLEREQLSRERVTRIQAEGVYDEFTAGIELRHEDIDIQDPGSTGIGSNLNGAFGDGEGLLVGARLGYKLSDQKTMYVAAQTVADDTGVYKENDLFSVGINTSINDDTALNFEVSDGDRGSALMGGVDFATAEGLNFNLSGGLGSGAISQFGTRYSIAEGHELYGSYTVDAERTESARNLLTLGQRRAFGNSLSLFTESQFGKSDRYANVAHVFGMEFDAIEDWRFSASMQFGENSRQGADFERRALSFGAFLQQEEIRVSSRIELREDDGVGVHNRQYVASNSLTKLIGKDNRLLGLLNLSWTDDELNGGRDARFVEFELGHAYRPTDNDSFNFLAKYSFLYDLPTEGQATARPDERSHLLALDGLYDFGNSWELGGKLAFRQGELRSMRDSGDWTKFGVRLAAVRARYNVNDEWDGLAEYRWLADFDGDSARSGALLGIYHKIGKHMKIGVGYNFTDFDDELRQDSYRNHGWFLDLIGQH